MAQQGVHLDRDQFCCSICLDLLKDPVTIPCGHSYCMGCIKDCWDHDDQKRIYICPQCRATITPRPVLKKNNIMAEVIEQLKKTGFQADTVSAAAERTERQKELGISQQKIQRRLQEREKEIKELQQAVDSLNHSADKAVEDSERIFTELIRSMETRRSEVKKLIRAQQKTAVTQTEELQKRLEQEIADLRRRDTELEQLSHTEDHIHFLQSYPSLSSPSESTDLPSINVPPLLYFADVTEAVSKLREKLEDFLKEQWPTISTAVNEVDVLLPPEPKTRADFLQYSCQITLDPNTAHKCMSLSQGNRKASLWNQIHSYPDHPERFINSWQVLSRENLTGHCYWEVEWSGYVLIAVSYKDISRTGTTQDCQFGKNPKSWVLECRQNGYSFSHNDIETKVSGPQSSRIGVYLDHRAGTLSFYSISDTMTLLHRVNTTFTQPLYAGLRIPRCSGDTAELCELK